MLKKRLKHSDGSACLEGTTRIPPRFKPCCAAFARRTTACVFDIRYDWWPKRRSWFTVIAESAGGGGIAMLYCPHCGAQLRGPGAKRAIKETRRLLSIPGMRDSIRAGLKTPVRKLSKNLRWT